MVDDPQPISKVPSPVRRRIGLSRIVKVLVVVDLAVLVVAFCIWLVVRHEMEATNVANPGLRGSAPPRGQIFPALAAIDGIEPPVPTAKSLRGHPVVLLATCIECRSGSIIGGFLGRLPTTRSPFASAQTHIVVWGGDKRSWLRRSGLGTSARVHPLSDIRLHVATTPIAVAQVRRALGIGPVQGAEESGQAFIYDPAGTWRSTYFIGQLDRDDIRHDVQVLANTE